ncbi:MAG: hypothetical protein AAGK37_00650 [Pseudomonadota bacterium]
MSDRKLPTVRRRRVFYIPGYDPHPPRRYRELYRTEAERQGEISGYMIAVRAREGAPVEWEAAAAMEGGKSHSRIEVLAWADIVRGTMDRSLLATYRQLLEVTWTYISTGALWRLAMLRRGPIIAGFFPVLALLAQAIVAALLGKLAATIVTGGLARGLDGVAGLFGAGAWSAGLVWEWADWLLGWLVFAAVGYGVLRGFRAIDGRIFAHYLMHDFAYTAQARGAYPAELDARISTFSERIAAALADPVDEVLVVGHSSGAQLAVSALARLARNEPTHPDGPALSLLTLGQAIPMVSFLPDARALRRDLHDLAASDAITWVDVSAPSDGGCFALCDPVAVTGVTPQTGARWPLVLSAAFSQTLSEETRDALRMRFFRLHFQYLCAFDIPGSYDYFRITAGPQTLGQRFAERKPSNSRIDVAVSGYRSMAV